MEGKFIQPNYASLDFKHTLQLSCIPQRALLLHDERTVSPLLLILWIIATGLTIAT